MTTEEWVGAHFERCWLWLDAALATSPIRTHEKEHVRAGLLSGQYQLWPGRNCACLAEPIAYPSGAKVLLGWLAGGDLDEIKDIALRIEDHARRNGYDGVGVTGRRGWLRAFQGYEDAGSTFVKRFD